MTSWRNSGSHNPPPHSSSHHTGPQPAPNNNQRIFLGLAICGIISAAVLVGYFLLHSGKDDEDEDILDNDSGDEESVKGGNTKSLEGKAPIKNEESDSDDSDKVSEV